MTSVSKTVRHQRLAWRRRSLLVEALAMTGLGVVPALGATADAQAPAAVTPALPVEDSDVAKLPDPTPSRLFLLGRGNLSVLDGNDPKLRSLGLVPVGTGGIPAVLDGGRIYVSETYYSHGNRGTRDDILSVYDGKSLDLEREIPLPGRLHVVPKTKAVDIGSDGKLGYVYDMIPASAIHVVDLAAGKVVGSVDIPGCALAFAVGPRRFASLCGDGTVGLATVADGGAGAVTYTRKFFDPDHDPVFEGSVVDRTTGEGWFVTFTGKIFPATLGDVPAIGPAWSILGAAQLPEAGPNPQELAWRPGGRQPMALHRASRRLFVLMHPGNHWTHKQGGTEIWVLDAVARKLVRRIPVGAVAKGVAISQGEKPRLYALDAGGSLIVFDADSGKQLARREIAGDMAWVPGN